MYLGEPDTLTIGSMLVKSTVSRIVFPVVIGFAAVAAPDAFGHGVQGDDQAFMINNSGPQIGPYIYLGAKHMVTGFDHLLFLAGVMFFLYRLRDVALYVTLFAVGHSATLLIGVLGGLHVNPYLVDAIIGLSVAYKAFENLGGFRQLGLNPDMRAAVFIFGLFHGFGLATKLQDLAIPQEGLIINMISFNIGVELGQFLALGAILLLLTWFRRSGRFALYSSGINVAILCAGFMLIGYQLMGYATT